MDADQKNFNEELSKKMSKSTFCPFEYHHLIILQKEGILKQEDVDKITQEPIKKYVKFREILRDGGDTLLNRFLMTLFIDFNPQKS